MADKVISNISDSINVWEGKIILVVEDTPSNYSYIAAVLRKTGAILHWAKNFEETMMFINSETSIDLVLMDIQLSGEDGYALTSKIKQLRPDVPIVAQTAYAMMGEKERSLKAGCDDYLSKPIRPNELLEMISKYIK